MNITDIIPASKDGPARVFVYGTEGAGKTTLACRFPKPVVLGAEQGIPRDIGFAVPTASPRRWGDVMDFIDSLTTDSHDFETLVIDTVDWIEPLIHAYVCERDSERKTEMNPKGNKLVSIEDMGFGKGYLAAEEEFRRLIYKLDVLQYRRRMHVVLVAHAKVATFKNPSGPDYDRWVPKCHDRISRVMVEWAENALFIHFEDLASKIPEDKERHKMSPDKARAKGVGGDVRLVGASRCAAYDAKNRVRLPFEMALGHDPTELIDMLLGKHLAPHEEPAPAKRAPKIAAVPPPVPAHHPDRAADEKARQDDAYARVRAVTTPEVAKAAWDGPAPDGSPPPMSEAERMKEAWEAERRAERESAKAEPAAKPKKPTQAEAKAQDGIEHELMKRVSASITAAGKISDVYRARVEGWLHKSGGDPVKLESIVNKVAADVAAATTNASN